MEPLLNRNEIVPTENQDAGEPPRRLKKNPKARGKPSTQQKGTPADSRDSTGRHPPRSARMTNRLDHRRSQNGTIDALPAAPAAQKGKHFKIPRTSAARVQGQRAPSVSPHPSSLNFQPTILPSTLREERNEILNALRRIEKGVADFKRECGDEIARLSAVQAKLEFIICNREYERKGSSRKRLSSREPSDLIGGPEGSDSRSSGEIRSSQEGCLWRKRYRVLSRPCENSRYYNFRET